MRESEQGRQPRVNGTAGLRQRQRQKSEDAPKPKKVPEDSKTINVSDDNESLFTFVLCTSGT